MAKAVKEDAIELLKADHRKVEGLFSKFEGSEDDNEKKALAEEICLELTIHAKIEEDVFYPACEGAVEEDLLKEAYVEHDGAKALIGEIEAADVDDEYFDAKVKVLSEMIAHHIEEEEKRVGGVFGQAAEADLDLISLGETMAEEKQRLMESYQKGGPPPPETTTFQSTTLG